MGSTEYVVREREKRRIKIDWSILSKHLKIERDGEVITDEWHLSPAATKVEFDLGETEPHHILILAGGLHPTEVRADGVLLDRVDEGRGSIRKRSSL